MGVGNYVIDAVKEIRMANKISQAKLVHLMHQSVGVISNVETNMP